MVNYFTWSFSDCFFKEGNLQFSLADYQQALEIDPTDTATKARIAVIHNEYGIQEYQAKTYQVDVMEVIY